MRGVLLDPKTGRPEPAGMADLLSQRAETDERFRQIVQFLDRDKELRQGIGLNRPMAADGLFYRDSRPPFMIADQTAITGTTEALAWPATYSSLPANYFGQPGKAIKFTAYGKITTAGASQGNITITVRYGTTTGGTSLGASTATALVASATNIPWRIEFYVYCRAIGTSGALMMMGKWESTSAVIASPSTLFMPASAPAQTTVDTTTAQGIVVGITMGSASDTLATQVLDIESLN